MVSAWWLLVALWVGGCIGFVASAVLFGASRKETGVERREGAEQAPSMRRAN